MTTPKKTPQKKGVTKRRPLKRTKPNRSGTASKKAASDQLNDREEHDHAQDPAIDEVVANAVRSSYDTLAQTIAQGREAADKFRQGQYNMREVPADVEKMILRLLDLARQLSGTTIDIVEQLLQQLTSAASLPEPGATKVPPFREHRPSPTTEESDSMPILVRFEGGGKGASSPTVSLNRPTMAIRPDQMVVAPLAPRKGKGAPLDKVEMSFDASIMGLVATVTVPPKQPPGTYVGYVVAPGKGEEVDEELLGLLVVKLA